MKLIEDNGEIIEDLPDDAAVMLFCRGESRPTLITPTMAEDAKVPYHILLAGAATSYLQTDYGREQVMSHLPPERKHHQH